MKKILSIICLTMVIISLFACSKSKKIIVGSGNIVTQTRDVTGFNTILFNGNGDLHITQGETESVRIEGEDNIVNLITTVVVDSALRIDYKKSNLAHLINTQAPVNIFVQVKDVQEIRITGSGTIVTPEPLKSYNLKVSLSGSGSGVINVVGNKLVSILSGTSNFTVKGNVENQDIWISGSGNYQADGLNSKVVNVNITGSGKVLVKAQDDIDVRISGAGSVIYEGNPRIKQSISGSGTVIRSSTSGSETEDTKTNP